ncbi:MAG: hypothetical protein KGS72_02550 [Cyanobacteria bacterium REEB67]|nr:hypothetical protein [Cyanobacteria bacterium REEB67]
MTERPEHAVNGSPTQDFSINKFFHDAYDKGIVKAVEDCPKEAAVTAAGLVAGAAAAVYLTKGGALAEMAIGTGGKAGPALTSTAESLIDRAVPITAESRAAAASADVLKMSPLQREAAIGRVEKHAAETAGEALKSPFAGFEQAGYKHVPFRGLPITAETRSLAASADLLKLPPWQRGASMRGIEKYLGQH